MQARFAGNQAVDSPPPPDEFIDYARYNALRLPRLCKYLQRRAPGGYGGYSILIFRLTAPELQAALDGPVVATHRIRNS